MNQGSMIALKNENSTNYLNQMVGAAKHSGLLMLNKYEIYENKTAPRL